MTKRALLHSVVISLLLVWQTMPSAANDIIRTNLLGYLPGQSKVAVILSESGSAVKEFSLIDAFTGKVAYRSTDIRGCGRYGRWPSSYRLRFTDFRATGSYYIKVGEVRSELFPINDRVYEGTADFVLQYMRQQRCGWNPYYRDSCHTRDGYIRYNPEREGQWIDVTGGWHDAADCLQYTTTSANAIYQMMFAYQQCPWAFADCHLANGLPGKNGVPDIVDEIYWGLKWLDKMNPAKGELYNQIADDRDHIGMRLPADDKADYGWGENNGRPVYYVSGKPQQRGKYMNRTMGAASTAGKFASCFALGSTLLKPFYPQFAEKIGHKASAAYQVGLDKPGNCQTASVVSPYIYEEDNWEDDMELGAMELYRKTGEKHYLQEAIEYGRREPITPWMGADSARHYQWYPFMNMGHCLLASDGNARVRAEFLRNMKSGLERVRERAADDPFLYGVPAIWCSNNLTTALLTQAILYRELSGDHEFEEMEGALRDWLLGCNPWGSSMICDLPMSGRSPQHPHSCLTFKHIGTTTGGLVDGPVYSTIFHSLKGVNIDGHSPSSNYLDLQPEHMVYHDNMNDYSSNEPTMDGTASLTFPLAYYGSSSYQCGMTNDKCPSPEATTRIMPMTGRHTTGTGARTTEHAAKGKPYRAEADSVPATAQGLSRRIIMRDYRPSAMRDYRPSAVAGRVPASIHPDHRTMVNGGIIRGDSTRKQVCLVFTAAEWTDGADKIISTLKKSHIHGGFFFTGSFFEQHADIVRRLVADGHYVGSHSYGHLLYSSWEKPDSMLVSQEEFVADMKRSYQVMAPFGMTPAKNPWFIPPYEYYNSRVASWARQLGLQVINFTPGTGTNADYTTPDMGRRYRSSRTIYNRLMSYERKHGLNGYFLLIHFGTHPARTDKFYDRLPRLIRTLQSRGYRFVSVEEMVEDRNIETLKH